MLLHPSHQHNHSKCIGNFKEKPIASFEEKEQELDIGAANFPKDPLLECLIFLCETYGKPKSAESIVAGLAYDKSGMGPSLFCEAAERADLKAEIFKKSSINKIPAAVLPCVIFLAVDGPCVLLEMNKKAGVAKIYYPETSSTKDVKIKDLGRDYAKHSIFVQPKASFKIADQKKKPSDTKHWFWNAMSKSRPVYGMVILASVFVNLFALVSPMFIMNVYDRVMPNNAIETGWALGIGALVAFMFDFVFRTIRGYLIDFAGRKTDIIAARRIYDHVLDMKLADRPQSSGAFANILRDFDSVREFCTSATVAVLVDVPFTILFLFIVYQLGGNIAFILVALILVTCFISFIIQMLLKRVVRKAIKTGQTRHGILVETISALETIKAGRADGRFRSNYSAVMSDDARYSQRSRFLSSLAVNSSTFFQQSASVFIVLAGMYLVQSGDLTMGGLIASVILGGRAIAPIGQIANLITRYHQAKASLNNLNEIMDGQVERPEGCKFLHRPKLSGKLAFEKVSFAYPKTGDVPVLDEVSFTIEPGERVGIIGRVGSGKSTIARLLLNLYQPTSGVVLADNSDYRQIDPADLRRNIAYISQDAQLFQGSVRDNITAFNSKVSEEELLACSKATGVDDFVSRHPMGYDAPVGEMGSHLSGGQRQAIAFARAMMINPQILICDEPTSSMDIQTEKAFCEYVSERTKDKTYILITHKQSLLSTVDRLILMHNGRVIMDGSRHEVVAALNSGKIKVKRT